MRQAVLEVRGRQRRSAACVTVQRSGPARPGTLSLSTEAHKRTTQRSAWVTEELQNGSSRSLPSTRHSAGGSTEGLASRRRQRRHLDPLTTQSSAAEAWAPWGVLERSQRCCGLGKCCWGGWGQGEPHISAPAAVHLGTEKTWYIFCLWFVVIQQNESQNFSSRMHVESLASRVLTHESCFWD